MEEAKIKIIENFLPESIFKNIQSIMLGPEMVWYYQNHTTINSNQEEDFYFAHIFFEDKRQRSELFQTIIHPILGRIDFNYLLRARGRLITRKVEQVPHEFHVDSDIKHFVALFSINSNNGYTLFENGEKSISKENTLLLFDGSLKHATVPQTDSRIRVNINLNFA